MSNVPYSLSCCVAGTLAVFFHTNTHKPDHPQHSAWRSVWLRPMSNHTFDRVDATVSAACRGWRGNPSRNGCGYTKASVILDDLLPKADLPAMLFQPDRLRKARLTDALDAINDHLGQNRLGFLRHLHQQINFLA